MVVLKLDDENLSKQRKDNRSCIFAQYISGDWGGKKRASQITRLWSLIEILMVNK